MDNQLNQNHSLRFQDSTSQAHYYEADEYNYGEYAGEYPVNLENAYWDDAVKKDWADRMTKDALSLRERVWVITSFCEIDMNRNEIPF